MRRIETLPHQDAAQSHRRISATLSNCGRLLAMAAMNALSRSGVSTATGRPRRSSRAERRNSWATPFESLLLVYLWAWSRRGWETQCRFSATFDFNWQRFCLRAALGWAPVRRTTTTTRRVRVEDLGPIGKTLQALQAGRARRQIRQVRAVGL